MTQELSETKHMNAPERIWAFPTHIDKTHGYFTPKKTHDVEVEYVRADLCTPTDERVKALVEVLQEITNRAEFAAKYHDDKFNFGWMIRKARAALRDMDMGK